MPGTSHPQPQERRGVAIYFMMICAWEPKDEKELRTRKVSLFNKLIKERR